MPLIHRAAVAAVAAGMTAAAGLAMAPAAGATAHQPSFIGQFHRLRTIGSTVPRNGDVNPYGMVAIRHTRGKLRRGHVLISNFNNKANLQGTGTTIVEISPRGHRTRFAHISASRLPGACPGGVGLTTALAVVHGWVIVGSLPTSNGMSATARAGCLIVLNSHGRVRETFSGHGINGPWDMTSLRAGRFAELFVTNVLNGTVAANGAVVHRGTVLRLTLRFRHGQPPQWVATTKIGSGFAERTDPAALVVGPTGVGLGRNGTLYVADSVTNRITAIPGRAVPADQRGHRQDGDQEWRAQHSAGPDHRAERQRAHRQRRERQDRGDHAGRHPGRHPPAGQLGQPARRRCPVRPGGEAARAGRLLRGRRDQHASPAALGTVSARDTPAALSKAI